MMISPNTLEPVNSIATSTIQLPHHQLSVKSAIFYPVFSPYILVLLKFVFNREADFYLKYNVTKPFF